MRSRRWIIGVGAALVGAVGLGMFVVGSGGGSDRRSIEEIRSEALALGAGTKAASLAAQRGFRGVIAAGVGGEMLFALGVGPKDVDATGEDAPTMDGRTIIDLASVSKYFTAAGVLALVQDGALDLDAPIEGIFGLSDGKPSGITVRHLLMHTTGRDAESALVPYIMPDKLEAVRQFLASREDHPPGKWFGYNNAAYNVLAAVIEVVSGRPFEEFMRQRLFEPAGMASSGFPNEPTMDRSRAMGRVPGMTVVEFPWGWGAKGTTGMLTTAEDLLAWDRAMAEGRVLSARMQEAMTEPGPDGPRLERYGEGVRYGLGLFVEHDAMGRLRTLHTGGARGTRVVFVRYPHQRVVLLVAGDELSNPFEIMALLEFLIMRRGE